MPEKVEHPVSLWPIISAHLITMITGVTGMIAMLSFGHGTIVHLVGNVVANLSLIVQWPLTIASKQQSDETLPVWFGQILAFGGAASLVTCLLRSLLIG